MQPQDSFFSRENRYSLGLDLDTQQLYAAIPVTNGVVDYEEYFLLTTEEYDRFLSDPTEAVKFVEACRLHKKDELLMQEPGWNRGQPT